MAGKKRKHGGGSASAHAKAQKKKTKQAAAAAALRDAEEAQQHREGAVTNEDAVMENGASDNTMVAVDVDNETDILSAELREELGGKDGDLMVIVGKKKKKAKEDVVPDEIMEQAAKMSKSKRKKLEHIAARKVKEARREDLYKSLESKSLSTEQLNLMLTTSKLGHKETLRERLKRSMNRVKAGISLSSEDQAELVQQRDAPAEDDSNDTVSSSEEESEEEEEEAAKAADGDVAVTAQKRKKNKKKKTSGAAGTTTTSAPQNGNNAATSTTTADSKKKKRKKTVVVNHVVPLQEDAPDGAAASTTATTTSTLTSPSTTLAPIALAAQKSIEDGAPVQRSTSQNDAMARLDALRKKNEERRRQKELGLANPKPAAAVAVEDDVAMDPAEVYVPKEIVIKTTEEMKALSKTTSLSYKTTLVQLKRKPEIQLARMQLPVCSSEQEIMEAITENDVIILCGETGSGKTTQVPQFLYEAGYGHPDHPQYSGRIGVTQPRRVAAVSTAKRVAEELNVAFGAPNGHVGYQIRYDAEHVGEKTRVKFMTDGILLKEIQQDFLLRQYSILLLDEAHERNVNTDILIGLLSRIAPLRAQMAKEEQEAFRLLSKQEQDAAVEKPINPLKLVVMSATLRVEDFTRNERLFPKPPPVLRVDARQYPVTVHFNKRTELDNYVDEAFKKVVKIHKKLPEGGVLVFLTGQREILQLCRKLRRAYSVKAKENDKKTNAARLSGRRQREGEMEVAPRTSAKDRILREHDDIEEEADLEDAQVYGDEEKAAFDLEEEDNKGEDDDEEDSEEEEDELAVPYMHVLPLYSLMPNDEQMRVFDTPPENHRLIVVATNVAETSLTIPGIKYVVDAGRTKERVFDLNNGISSFDIQWISKASADQRAGRAGRTGPGHCYRLYSSAVYDTEFSKFSAPEILCQPIEDLVLQMKAMGIHNVLQFPFPTPPDRQAVKMALNTLVNLGAISEGEEESITPLGHVLVKFPVAARFAKMLLLAKELGVLEYTIAIVAGLSGHSPFIHTVDRREKEKEKDDKDDEDDTTKEPEDEMEREWREAEELRKHAQWFDADSDVLSLLRAAGAYAYTGGSSHFCQENHLHEKTMQNMLKLRQQLTRIVNLLYVEDDGGGDDAFTAIKLSPRMPPPDHDTQIILRQIVAAGFLDQVAKRVPPGAIAEGTKIERNCAYIAATGNVKEPVYIHPHSSVFTPNPAKLPGFVVYQHIMRTTRAYMKMVTSVEPGWLASIGKNTPMCKYSQPLAEPSPFYSSDLDQVQCYAKAQYGVHQWALPVVQIAYPEHDHHEEKDGLAGKYRWFAKFLLDGQVVPGLKPFSGSALKEPSHMLIRKKFDKKIQLLVHKLQKHQVGSRASLVAMWQDEDATFLRTELKAWIKDDQQALFSKSWKAIVQQATRD